VQPKPADLADGIGEALVTTYEGSSWRSHDGHLRGFPQSSASCVVEVGEITEELMSRFKTPSAST